MCWFRATSLPAWLNNGGFYFQSARTCYWYCTNVFSCSWFIALLRTSTTGAIIFCDVFVCIWNYPLYWTGDDNTGKLRSYFNVLVISKHVLVLCSSCPFSKLYYFITKRSTLKKGYLFHTNRNDQDAQNLKARATVRCSLVFIFESVESP